MARESRRAPACPESRSAASAPPGSLHHDGPGIHSATDARERDRDDLVRVPGRRGLFSSGEDDGCLIAEELLGVLQLLDALIRVELRASRIDELVVLRV